MIDEHFFPRGLVKPLAHLLQSGGAVEINSKKYFGILNERFSLCRIVKKVNHFF